MKSDKPRPVFKAVKTATGYASPEELFYKLSRREKTHGYLRGPQQDVLREYAEKHADSSDLAFELPTGTGKTAVGLLISEWKRLQVNKVAYLSLTNQLAGQVLGITRKQPEAQPKDYEEAGADEVRYSKAMWEDDFAYALETAHRIADRLNSPELAGYRAWWWYLGSIAAALSDDNSAEQDALRRGASCGVNSGWLKQLLRERKAAIPEKESNVEPNAESVWDLLARWGWAGPYFEQNIGQMLDQLKDAQH